MPTLSWHSDARIRGLRGCDGVGAQWQIGEQRGANTLYRDITRSARLVGASLFEQKAGVGQLELDRHPFAIPQQRDRVRAICFLDAGSAGIERGFRRGEPSGRRLCIELRKLLR